MELCSLIEILWENMFEVIIHNAFGWLFVSNPSTEKMRNHSVISLLFTPLKIKVMNIAPQKNWLNSRLVFRCRSEKVNRRNSRATCHLQSRASVLRGSKPEFNTRSRCFPTTQKERASPLYSKRSRFVCRKNSSLRKKVGHNGNYIMSVYFGE